MATLKNIEGMNGDELELEHHLGYMEIENRSESSDVSIFVVHKTLDTIEDLQEKQSA